jgi:hypothetical protein
MVEAFPPRIVKISSTQLRQQVVADRALAADLWLPGERPAAMFCWNALAHPRRENVGPQARRRLPSGKIRRPAAFYPRV